MLQFPDFHEKLLDGLCRHTEGSSTTEHAQSLILDILCWLAGVFSNGPCRSEYRDHSKIIIQNKEEELEFAERKMIIKIFISSSSLKEGKEGLLVKTRTRLKDIVRVCFFEAGRSIAHKCARFLALCIRYFFFLFFAFLF